MSNDAKLVTGKNGGFWILERYLPNFVVVRPNSIPEDLPCNPNRIAQSIIAYPWDKEYGAKHMIWDTITETSDQLAQYVTVGTQSKTKVEAYGKEEEDLADEDQDEVANFDVRTNPMLFRPVRFQDYDDAQQMTMRLLRLMTRKSYNLFVLGHEKEKTIKVPDGQGGYYSRTTEIGLSLSGVKLITATSTLFNEYVFLTNESQRDGMLDIYLHLRDSDYRKANFRTTAADVSAKLWVPPDYEGQANVIRQLAEWAGIDLTSDDPFMPKFSLCCYAPGGYGKTQLFTSLPEEMFAQGPAVYVAADPVAVHMRSTWKPLLSGKTKEGKE